MINRVPAGNVYPGLSETLGQEASGMELGPTPEAHAAGTADLDDALRVGGQASPLIGLLVFVLLAWFVMWLAGRFGDTKSFSNIKGSAFNILFISLVAVAGIPAWKYLFTVLKVPGVSTWVHSV